MRILSSRKLQKAFTIGPVGFLIDLNREHCMSWPGVTMFMLFFGIATMDALTSRNWVRIVFWVLMGVAFAVLDWWGQHRRASSR